MNNNFQSNGRNRKSKPEEIIPAIIEGIFLLSGFVVEDSNSKLSLIFLIIAAAIGRVCISVYAYQRDS